MLVTLAVHMRRTALGMYTLLWAFLSWGVCFVKLGERKLLKRKQNSMIFLRKTVYAFQWSL
uniref:RNL n=1 Tax=Arundo donax TaxID=35708 RepID=A0A0A9CPD9_ARUDO